MAAFWEIAAHLAYDIFSLYNFLIVYLVFSHLGINSGNFSLIVPFPDHCVIFTFLFSSVAGH